MSTVRLSTTCFLTAMPGISPPATALRIAVQWWYAQVPHRSDPYRPERSEEHTSELQSLMRISYAVFCLKKKKQTQHVNQSPKHTMTQLHTKTRQTMTTYHNIHHIAMRQ